MKMERASSSATSLSAYTTTRCDNTEDKNLRGGKLHFAIFPAVCCTINE
jgi:hypothetical protein